MYFVRSVKAPMMRSKSTVFARALAALSHCKSKPTTPAMLALLYEIPDETAKRIVREVEATRSKRHASRND